MKKPLLFVLAGILALSLAAIFLLSRQTYVVELSQEQLQEHLEKGFPLEKGVLVFTLQLTDPKVTLRNGSDRIHFSMKIDTGIRIDGVTPRGTAAVETKLRYVPDRGEFYMSDPDVVLDLDSMTGGNLEKINEIANVLVKEFSEQHPLYRLQESDLKQNVARAVVRDIRVEGGALKIHLGLN
jgi:hypothetical protein